uniref:Uncharacterized protein n=1 Tax=Avena sativa TaxID=4498 RepID=A0ACD6A971_AVESA
MKMASWHKSVCPKNMKNNSAPCFLRDLSILFRILQLLISEANHMSITIKNICCNSNMTQRSIHYTQEEKIYLQLLLIFVHSISCQQAIDSKPLLDIIGVINDVGPYEYASPMSQKKLRKIKIRNLDEQTQELVLWGQHGESFDENTVLQKSKEGIVVVIFAGMTATLQKLTGMIQGSSSSATQVYLNLDIPEAQKYNSSYKWKYPTLHKHLPQVRQVSPLEAVGKVYTIGQIISQPTSSFQGGATLSTIAKVTSIIPSVKWYYKACKHCGKGYNNVSDTATCTCQFPVSRLMYKLPLTLTDSSGSLDAIAFSKVGEDLVERLAEQVCMNMKIDVADHVVTLDNAIGKERLFYIGMNTESAGKYPINYVLKRSFLPNDTNLLFVPTSSSMIPLSPVAHKQDASYANTPPIDTKTSDHIKEPKTRSAAKRSINFIEVDAATIKRQKQHNADNNTATNNNDQQE